MEKVWVGLIEMVGGYEGGHTSLVVCKDRDEAMRKLWDKLVASHNGRPVTDWENRTWDFAHFESQGGEFFDETKTILRELTIGEMTDVLPL